MRDFSVDGKLVGRPAINHGTTKVSTAQHYPIGTIYETHGRRFRYCCASEAVTGTHRGLVNQSLHGGDTGGGVYGVMGAIGTKAYEGDRSVIMANLANGNPQTLFPVDWFYGGTINFYIPHADYTDLLSMRVSGSELASATAIKIWLDEPLPCDIAVTVFTECHASPYLNVGVTHSDQFSCVVVNYVELSVGDYFWGQTRGPCYVQRNVGVDTDARMKVFTTPGGIMEDADTNDIRQAIGYALTPNVSDGMVMLMLE